ncbi:hypothetical protein [Granulicella tundricola]|nr:hypothetical protein [Granulicella tundricola]
MANIQITAKGHDHVHGIGQPILPNIVIQGDQINTHGPVGAVGRNSIGTINYQQQWAGVLNQVSLSQVAIELESLRTELVKTAKVPADFQQLGLIAEAEQHAEKQDGTKVMEVLSKAGRSLLDFAKALVSSQWRAGMFASGAPNSWMSP